jgi:hypothetical protein
VLNGATHRLADLDAAAEELHTHLRAIAWPGSSRTPAIVKVSREAKDAEERLVASAALVHLEAPGGAERSMTVVERAANSKAPLSSIALTILRALTGQHFLACVRKVFEKTKTDSVRALLLPLLVERGQLTQEQLLPLIDHAHDDIAIEAALALAAIGDAQHAATLAACAARAKDPRRANALIFAAAVLGSADALAKVRAQVHKREDFDEHLIDALAIAGDESDASLLLDLATHPDADADYAVFAAANLGSAATIAALPAFTDRVAKDVLDEARRLILGNNKAAPASRSETPSLRLLRGQPWSVAGVLALLAAGDETVREQRRLALELRVRTGLVPPTVLPVFAPDQPRAATLASWTNHFSRASGRLPPGQWYYQGKPARLAHKELA